MNDSKKHIDEIAAKGEGFTVPEGYFDDFATKMSGRLPFREVLDTPLSERPAPRNTRWLRVRPYVYMAAMFAGAWCLLKMFSLMSANPDDINIDSYPELSQALENDQFVEEYIINDIPVYDLTEDYYPEEFDELHEPLMADENYADTDEPRDYRLPTDGYEN